MNFTSDSRRFNLPAANKVLEIFLTRLYDKTTDGTISDGNISALQSISNETGD